MEMQYFKSLIQKHVKGAKIIVELGVGKAESSHILLEAMDKKAILYSYDNDSKIVAGNDKNWIYSNVGGVKGFEAWDKGDIDFLFVDTDPHSFDQTYLWCLAWFSLLKEGGISLWHDAELKRAGVDVKGALQTFAKYHKVDLSFIEENYGMGIMKCKRA